MIRTFALVGLCVVVSHTLARQTYPILLTAIQDDFDLSTTAAAFLVTATFIAYMAGVATMTYLSGRTEPKVTLIGGLLLGAAGFAIMAVAPGFIVMALGIGLSGLASAGVWLSAPVLVTGAAPIERRGMAMGFLSSSIGIGLVVVGQAIRIVRNVADDDSIWRPIWIGAATYSLVMAILIAVFLKAPKTKRVATRLNLAAAKQVPGWLQLTGAYILFGFVISAYSPFLGAALEEQDFRRSHIATLYSMIGISAIFGAVALGRLSDRIGRRPVLAGAMLGLAISCLLVMVGREPFASISVIINGTTSYAFPVLITAQIRDHLSDRAFSNALGAITFIYGTALVAGPVLAGPIIESPLGFTGLYGIVAVIATIGAAVVSRLPSLHAT